MEGAHVLDGSKHRLGRWTGMGSQGTNITDTNQKWEFAEVDRFISAYTPTLLEGAAFSRCIFTTSKAPTSGCRFKWVSQEDTPPQGDREPWGTEMKMPTHPNWQHCLPQTTQLQETRSCNQSHLYSKTNEYIVKLKEKLKKIKPC